MKLLSLVFLFFLYEPIAGASLTEPDKACLCDPTHKDFLEEPQRFNFGQFEGQCVDSCHFRRARISKRGEIIGFGNILNEGEFFETELKVSDIETVEMGFEKFLPAISHIFLKFTLKKNAPSLVLHRQWIGNEKTIESRSLVLSSEAVPPKGHHYQIFESYFGNYLLATRIATGREMERWAKELHHPVTLYPLKVKPSEGGEIFRQGLENSESTSLKSIYKLFTDNCSTRALSFIDLGIHHQMIDKFWGWTKFEEALPLIGPLGTKRALRSRNLISD